jgi:hypothetical protein
MESITKNKWEPLSDIDSPFDTISYSFQGARLSVNMVGQRNLHLEFSNVVAIHFEQECPGFDFPPHPLPMLRPGVTFPLLIVEGSEWQKKYSLIYKDVSHFALISSDHLMQVLAKSDKAIWVN